MFETVCFIYNICMNQVKITRATRNLQWPQYDIKLFLLVILCVQEVVTHFEL